MKSMHSFRLLAVLTAVLLPHTSFAAGDSHATGDEAAQLRGIVREIMHNNAAFVKAHQAAFFAPFTEKQQPRATVVTCADSRVHAHALDATPDGDLFMVRNIGNQVGTAEGSVEYGVHHLHTPLLIIVGHVACGAIKAVQGGYAGESASIKRELDTIRLPQSIPANSATQEWLRGVDANVNNQVAFALKKFEPEVRTGKLTVIGAIYDFQNAMQQGQGKLVVTNINGNSDKANVLAKLGQLTASKVVHAEKAVHKTVQAADKKREPSTEATFPVVSRAEIKPKAKLVGVANYKSSMSTAH